MPERRKEPQTRSGRRPLPVMLPSDDDWNNGYTGGDWSPSDPNKGVLCTTKYYPCQTKSDNTVKYCEETDCIDVITGASPVVSPRR